MSSYARLAQLPPPKAAQMDVGSWVRRAVAMETRLDVRVAMIASEFRLYIPFCPP